jgi:hypothetical protein
MFRQIKSLSKTRKPGRLVSGFIVIATSAVVGTTGIAAAQPSQGMGHGYGGNVTNNNNVNVTVGNIKDSAVDFAINIVNGHHGHGHGGNVTNNNNVNIGVGNITNSVVNFFINIVN